MYDPLTDPSPGQLANYPDSYWASSFTPTTYPTLKTDIHSDVVVIGGGYTGLSCALHLAKQGVEVTLLEANRSGWGCSGRNGGFVLNGTGRLSYLQMQQKWGKDSANLLYRENRAAIDLVSELIEQGDIACDANPGGYLKIAHRAHLVDGLKQQAAFLQHEFGDPVSFITKEQLASDYMRHAYAHGGLLFPYCFGVHPLKLADGYARMASTAGASLYQGNPVTDWQKQADRHVLITPQAKITANKVVIATNGYTPNKFHAGIDRRHFPVLSSVIVTEPLSDTQLAACGLKPGVMVMDTRALKYYYRLLPDGRLLFGGRGAIRGKDADKAVYKQRLLAALIDSFPALNDIQLSHFWSGWVSVSLDDYPRINQLEQDNSVFYAMGYCGSGVSFATRAGHRLAQMVTGSEPMPALPYFQSQLTKFPFSPFRRVGLSAFYHWGRLKDEWL